MATWMINEAYGDRQSIEADDYTIADGYFQFSDEQGAPVFAIAVSRVSTIARK